MGDRARQPARLPVAAPASTQASSNATRASARFLGPSTKPPCSGSRKTPVMPDASKCARRLCLAGVQAWVLRAPSATSRATGPRATARVDCTNIWRSYRLAKRHWICRTSSPGNARNVSGLGSTAVAMGSVLSGWVSSAIAMPGGIAPKMVQLGREWSQRRGCEGVGRVNSPLGGQVVGAGAAFGRGGQGSGLCLAFETIKAQIGGSKGIGRWRAALRAGARWGGLSLSYLRLAALAISRPTVANGAVICELLVTQRRHGIYAGRPPRGDVAGE